MDSRLGSLFLVAAIGVAAALAIVRSRPAAPLSIREESPAPFGPAEGTVGDFAQGELPPNHPPVQPNSAAAEAELPPGHPPLQPFDSPAQAELPPGHPAIQSTDSVHGSELVPASERPAITWQVPRSWQSVKNASAMRIATYHVPAVRGSADEAELTVVSAGGSTEANIKRWLGQFDNAGPERITERAVRGLKVTIVEVNGTFTSGGMMSASAEPARHPAWALLGAIVEVPGSPYFFKLLGPAATLRAARTDFQTMIDSIAPGARGPTL